MICGACPFCLQAVSNDMAYCLAGGPCERLNIDTRHPHCPLIPVPDHGDLIDRDALMTRLGMAMDCEDCPNRTALYFCGLPREVMEVCDELENTPVVIPAERR